MKKRLFLIAFLALLIAPLAILAQEPVPPVDPLSWLARINEMLGSFWGLTATVVLFVPIVIGFLNLNEAKKWVKYVVTGVLALVAVLLAKFVPFGYLVEAKWWYVVITYVGVLGSQVLSYAALKPLLDKIAEKFNPWKTGDGT